VAYSPDGTRVVSASNDATLRCWDAATGEQIGNPWTGHTDGVWAVAYSPDGTRVVSASGDATLRCWDAATGDPELTIASGPDGSSATWQPDQRLTSVRGEAWRWLRVTTYDATGRTLSVDPYEWHYPTEGGPAPHR